MGRAPGAEPLGEATADAKVRRLLDFVAQPDDGKELDLLWPNKAYHGLVAGLGSSSGRNTGTTFSVIWNPKSRVARPLNGRKSLSQ